MHIRDTDIRSSLMTWLDAKHSKDEKTVIFEEFAIPRPSARADVVLINGEISVFEIKSDVDSLSRLPRQLSAYNCFFEKISFVTTAKHQNKLCDITPKWCGIFLYEHDRGIKQLRAPKNNFGIKLQSVLYALKKAELESLSRQCEVSYKRSDTKRNLVDSLSEHGTPATIMPKIREILKNRQISLGNN